MARDHNEQDNDAQQQWEGAIPILRNGGLIVYPTETLYGIGADALSPSAVKRVFLAKRRPFNLPIPLAVSDLNMMDQVAYVDPLTRSVYQRFLPGPLMLVLPKRPAVPDVLTAGSDDVGIRVPDRLGTLEMIGAFGPITATSANLHGGASPVTVEDARRQLGSRIAHYIDDGPCRYGRPSTVLHVSQRKVLRGKPSNELLDFLRRK